MTTRTRKPRQHADGDRSRADVPYAMRLPDGSTLYVELPRRWVTRDRSGEPAFLPKAIQFLDQIRALAIRLDRPPSPGYIAALRRALGLTQAALGKKLGVDKVTVSRWERGTVQPGPKSLSALEALRRKAARRGVKVSA